MLCLNEAIEIRERSILQVNISFYVDRIFDLILAKTRTLYLIVCSAFDALC